MRCCPVITCDVPTAAPMRRNLLTWTKAHYIVVDPNLWCVRLAVELIYIVSDFPACIRSVDL